MFFNAHNNRQERKKSKKLNRSTLHWARGKLQSYAAQQPKRTSKPAALNNPTPSSLLHARLRFACDVLFWCHPYPRYVNDTWRGVCVNKTGSKRRRMRFRPVSPLSPGPLPNPRYCCNIAMFPCGYVSTRWYVCVSVFLVVTYRT